MNTYRFTAIGTDGHRVEGRVQAASADQALAALLARGWRDPAIQPLPGSSAAAAAAAATVPRQLPAAAAEEVMARVAEVAAAELPLAAGLRAAAWETGDERVSAALLALAGDLDRGLSLDEAMNSDRCPLPAYARSLIRAAARTGKLAPVLDQIVEHQRSRGRLRQSIAGAFLYPLVVACVAVAVLSLILVFLVGIFQRMFEDFQLTLPMVTQLLLWFREHGLWVLAGFVATGLLVSVAAPLLLGRERWLSWLASAPLFGRLWSWAGFSDWCGLLGLLLRYQIPLPESLRLAADGTWNAHVSAISLRLADSVGQGQSLSRALGRDAQLPASIVPLLRWGETSQTLEGALAACRELFEQRVQARVVLLRSVVPPLLFIAIACCVLFVIGALFMPLMSMIQGLS